MFSKNSLNKLLLNQVSNEDNSFKLGFLFFNLGLFFLLSAQVLGVIAILISIIFSVIKIKSIFKEKRINKFLILISLVLIINTLISVFYKINQFEEWNFISNVIGLFNWIPFFLCFFFIQPYLKNTKYRTLSAYLLLIGTFPLLITGIGQYYFGWENQLSTFYGNMFGS